MSEKKFVVRFSTAGGEQLQATLVRLGESGEFAFDKISVATDKTTAKLPILEAAVERQRQAFRDLENSLDPTVAATRRYEAAVEQATMAVKMGVATQEEANRVMALARARMDTMGGSITRGLAPGVRELRFHVQNTAYQIGDLATQIGAGTAASVALGQQLPQLIGGFGMVGAVIGALVAVGVPALAFAIRNAREETVSYEDALDASRSAMDALTAAAGEASRLQDEFTTAISEGNVALADRLVRLAELSKLEADARSAALPNLIRDQAAALRESEAQYREIIASFVDASQELGRLQEQLKDPSVLNQTGLRTEIALAQDYYDQQKAAYEDATTAIEIQQIELERLKVEQENVNATIAEAERIINDMKAALDGAVSSAETLSSLNLAGPISTAANAAAQLAQNLQISVNAASALLASGYQQRQEVVFDPRTGEGGMGRSATYDPIKAEMARIAENYGRVSPFDLSRMPVVSGSGSGGSSGGGGGGGMSDDMRDAQRIFEETRTEAERYAEELARVNELHDLGLLNTDTYNRALADLKEEYGEGNVAAQEYAEALKDITNSFVDIATGAKTTAEAFADMLDQMARDLLNSGIQTLLEQAFAPILGGTTSSGGGLLGGLLGGLGGGLFGGPAPGSGNSILGLPSADGGGYTGFGPRSGGLDGRGGFLAMLHPRETIIDHTKSSRGAGGGTININLTGVSGDDAIRRAVQQGVTQGLAAYDRSLPSRVRQISGDPRAI
jgi:hypothetical protein